jgi:hypothetical protein
MPKSLNQYQTIKKWDYLLFKNNTSITLIAMLCAVYIFPVSYLLFTQSNTLNFYGNVVFTISELQLILFIQTIYLSYWIYIFKISKWYDFSKSKVAGYYFFRGELFFVLILYSLPLPNIIIYLIPFLFMALAGLGRVGIKKILLYMFLMGVAELLVRDGRVILINSILLCSLFTFKQKWKVLVAGVSLLFLAIFILLPLRHGHPINLSINGLTDALLQVYNSIVPIIIGAILSINTGMSNLDLFADYFPLGRSIFGGESFIDKIAYKLLPIDKYEEGVRLGSNPAAMFKIHLSAQLILIFSFFTILMSSIYKVKKSLNNVFIIYILWYFSMILRRSFTTFIADSIALLIISLMLISLRYILPKIKNKNE